MFHGSLAVEAVIHMETHKGHVGGRVTAFRAHVERFYRSKWPKYIYTGITITRNTVSHI